MAKYMFAYHGGKVPDTPEEGEAVMAAWGAWMTKYGKNLVDPGSPFGKSTTVTAAAVEDNGGANPLSGYTIMEASDLDEAIKIAQECPMVADGSGSAEIAEIQPM